MKKVQTNATNTSQYFQKNFSQNFSESTHKIFVKMYHIFLKLKN